MQTHMDKTHLEAWFTARRYNGGDDDGTSNKITKVATNAKWHHKYCKDYVTINRAEDRSSWQKDFHQLAIRQKTYRQGCDWSKTFLMQCLVVLSSFLSVSYIVAQRVLMTVVLLTWPTDASMSCLHDKHLLVNLNLSWNRRQQSLQAVAYWVLQKNYCTKWNSGGCRLQ